MPDSTTIPEVLNRALDLGEKGFQELIKVIENIAPKTWEIAITQVYADAIGNVLYTLFPMISFLLIIFFSKKYWYPPQSYIDNISKWSRFTRYEACIVWGYIVPTVGVFITLIITLLNLVTLAKVCTNPEYYAIKLMLSWI